MSSIISLGFSYKGEEQYVLVSTKEKGNQVIYKITIMNGQLETFMGNANLVIEENGRLLLDNCQGDYEILQLKKSIVKALADYLNKEVTYQFEQDNW